MLPGIARDIDRGVEQGDWWIGPALAAAPEGGAVRLPPGAFTLTEAALEVRNERPGGLLIGAGVGATSLRLDRALSALAAGPPHTESSDAWGGPVLHCGIGPAACRLALPQGGLTIAEALLALDPAAVPAAVPVPAEAPGLRLQSLLPSDAEPMITARQPTGQPTGRWTP
jgi:hypothetical protein